MKNLMKVILPVMMILALLCSPALAQGTDASARFDNVWMAEDGTRIDAYTEEGGYILEIHRITDIDAGTGFVWEVHGLYNDGADRVDAVSVVKWDAYTEDGEVREGTNVLYEDLENTSTFSLNEKGNLIWSDSREDAGAGLEFIPIGRYEGIWPATEASAQLMWADEYYTVYIDVRNEKGQTESYLYNAFYNRDTGRLEAIGSCELISFDAQNNETGREALEESFEAELYIDGNHDLVWENKSPIGVKTMTFQNQFNASLEPNTNG